MEPKDIIYAVTTFSRYRPLYNHMVAYCKGNEVTAQAFIVQKCLEIYQYDSNVWSVTEALDKLDGKVRNGLFKLDSAYAAKASVSSHIPMEDSSVAEKRIKEKNAQLPHTTLKTGSGEFEFVVKTENGVQYCELIKATNLSTKIKIPKSDSEGHPVVGIGERAFFGNDRIVEVDFTENIKYIDDYAFCCCAKLNFRSTYPNLERYGTAAFAGCASLTTGGAGDSVVIIGDYAFACCDEMTGAVLGKNVKSVGKKAFAYCPKLTSISHGCSKDEVQSISFGEDWHFGSAGNFTFSRSGCYVATCVYGSYDCPQVWTLRRFRDDTLGATWYGRAFIRTYYAISPMLVKWFGETTWFKRMWQGTLDKMVSKLNSKGVADTPYNDRAW